ncbi:MULTISPECIES: ATP synthase subunit B [unclassified Methylobacterium]|uniref:F0F1 ATP synthase subunit B family protein n=1 Tax=unclassified Methylobacterium TaxID=2615210 RepID=UPI0007005D24|nr:MULTISPECIES: ATP synthase subunit B [unclassified Methylobacterium]KQO66110.1 ATP synthase subunit B [Methylobacterium sp. Leaf89]KQO73255.1 ATP synthase subunit B [Methylobacterium sp. Leaf88]KQP66239.1 ATP synthase subunit B [Methylobacterium sp. Leaf111]KQU26314.1 ATP synthase subunit B [Methylobacterium sp. Leaf94]
MAQPAHSTATHEGFVATPAAEHGGGFPPFESHTFASQLIWLALAFGLLYYLMDKIALPRIQAILHDRAVRLSGDLDEAQRLKAEADAAGAAYEKSLSDAQAKAQAIALETRTALSQEAETKRKALEAELNARIAASEATLRTRTAEAMGNVRGIAGETASAIVERLTGRSPDEAALAKALDSVSFPH